jgi:uncharacterized protein
MATPPKQSRPRTRVRRVPANAHYDRESVHRVLDRGLIAHVSFAEEGQPYCIPTLYARVGERVLIHGSSASRMVRVLATGVPACLTVTLLDGLVLARSVFETSVNYDSVVLFGQFRRIQETEAKLDAVKAFVDVTLPGRWAEARPPTRQELKATAILELEITEVSVKSRSHGPDDDDSPDAALDTWAGVIPIETHYGAPRPSPALRDGVALDPSIDRLLGGDG